MDILEQVKANLSKTNSFVLSSVRYDDSMNIVAETYSNYIIAQPLTAESERQLRMNPYNRLLKSDDYLFALFYFPSAVHSKLDRRELEQDFAPKYTTRLKNLFKSQELGNIKIRFTIALRPHDFVKLQYIARPYDRSKTDFDDDRIDTVCKTLTQEQKSYIEKKSLSIRNNTLLILHNAREQGNRALSYYQDVGTTAFYTDCIINYVLEQSGLLNPDSFQYPNSPHEVHMPVKTLFKLYPHRTFKLVAPEGVTLTYETRPYAKRLSKNDTAIFKFSDEFLNKYRAIIMRSESNAEQPNSFIKVPMFFVLQALQSDKLTSKGFNFLLWFLPFFRIKKPKIYHSLRTILAETGADVKHGFVAPLKILNRYFDYLFSVNTFYNIQAPVVFTRADLDSPPKFNGALLQVQKPKLPKPKKD